jgi:hypothetical protein
MKTTRINSMARLTGLTIALALLTGIAGNANAQELETTKGAGARRLLELNRKFPKPAPAESVYQPMSCLKCKDEVLKTKDWTARGANKPYVTIVRHLCAGCSDTITVTGHGKEKQNVVTHKCTSCGAEDSACCNTKKGSNVATKGMEKAKSIDIAPLK